MDESAQESKLTIVTDDPLSKSSVPDNNKTEWVKFDDEENVVKSDVQNEKVNRNNCLLFAQALMEFVKKKIN